MKGIFCKGSTGQAFTSRTNGQITEVKDRKRRKEEKNPIYTLIAHEAWVTGK